MNKGAKRTMPDDRIAVVGAGIVGRSIALALAARGQRVVLIDAADDRAAPSWGNAGHIATEQVAPIASWATIRSMPKRLFWRGGPVGLPIAQIATWLPFAARLVAASGPKRFAAGQAALAAMLAQAMPAWERLAHAIGRRDLLREDGHLIAWESAASAAAGRAHWGTADTGTARLGEASADDLARLRALSPGVVDAVRFTGTGQIADLTALADALDAALAAAGVERLHRHATLERHGRRIVVEGVAATRVVIAAGVGSAALMAAAGHAAVPLIAERGYHLRGDADGWPADLPPVVFEDRSIIVTRYADQVQVAGFVEFGRADAPPDPRKSERLCAHVTALRLPIAGPFRRWMGARPTLPDYLPAIGRSTRADNLYYAFGHQHLGLTLGPITGEWVAALMLGDAPVPAAFDVERF
ncbi:NAD(P)/FAD-dependent oxidoreductase [Sphingomonas sp. Leaf4]|uniref:NAD(P)/FAD-dependent oxidoreductase n=1 Tax=Sphingomonas sp. Leaf4 TaxID=2876553 RepID=UPI001E2B179B|nr:FAD-binding oxidoreductase [Sphingomonas sp. Leaf4]